MAKETQPLVSPDLGALTVLTPTPLVHLLLLSCISVAQNITLNEPHQSAMSMSKHKK